MRKNVIKYVWLALFFAPHCFAQVVVTKIYSTNTPGKLLGTVVLADTQYGLLITPQLKGLQPGLHGFHVHENPSCANRGMAAGGHYDPAKTNQHLGPYDSKGHLGDLPPLYVDAAGVADQQVLAPRLTVAEIGQRTLVVHEGGDNCSDQPLPNGGGGARVACGVIPK